MAPFSHANILGKVGHGENQSVCTCFEINFYKNILIIYFPADISNESSGRMYTIALTLARKLGEKV